MKELSASMKFFWSYFRHFLFPLILVIAFVLIGIFFEVQAPAYLGSAITSLTKYLSQFMNPATRSLANRHDFNHFLLKMMLFFIASAIAQFAATYIMIHISSRTNGEMRTSLFNKLMRLPIKYFDTHQDGEILARFTTDLDNIFNGLNQGIYQILNDLALWFGVIIMMFKSDVKLAWVTMATTPLALILALTVIKIASKYVDRQQEALSSLNGYINEQVTGQKLNIANSLQSKSIAGFNQHNQEVKDLTLKGTIYSSMLFPLMQGISLVNTSIVIFYGAYLVTSGQVTGAVGLGLIVTFVEYSSLYYQPIMDITSMYNMLQLAFTGSRRLLTIFKHKDEVNSANPKNYRPLKKEIEFKDVRFSYEPNKEIIHGLNQVIEKGQMVALVGPTGSGKTTVMNLLNRFYDLDTGQILYDGTNLREFSLKSLRRNVGIVLQDAVVFSGTIEDNIKFGQPDASDEQMYRAAELANIHNFIMSLPRKYKTRISNENLIFSTGQLQLVSIARTILTNPDLLVLDEATSNVDTVTEAHLQDAMNNVIKGRTSFVIAHRLKTIRNADNIMVLKNGVVIETGSHAQLLRENGFYAELYRNQMLFE
ncbi:ABC transporter ATP-binding protein [Xylocopilactobacillus apicola]|uniref:Multidrug ABC transporter permease n=1 Tax=Xylocopilactobacillus apicola TaxID=2932184 RepID=A0AAU9DBD1_9LACO|nr:ABC transporter ATP-binding protein [Xylocopilactobacillus apicola]BDR58825.1 multidrug ABC transporter permease [Xylocopilactobacillus apicola]